MRALEAAVALDTACDQLACEGLAAVWAARQLSVFRAGIARHDFTLANLAVVPAGSVRPHPYSRGVEYDPLRRGIAELIGTFTLIFVGMGSIMFASSGVLGVALAHGLAIAIMVSAVGHISGGHFNPAVTLGFLVTRRIAPALAASTGSRSSPARCSAALALRATFPDEVNLDSGVPVLNSTIGVGLRRGARGDHDVPPGLGDLRDGRRPGGAFKSIAGLAIGLTITIGVLAAGPLTGAALNPARALGPELVFNVWDDWWVYIVGPGLGGAAAALLYNWLYLRPAAPVPVVGTAESGVLEPRPGDAATD